MTFLSSLLSSIVLGGLFGLLCSLLFEGMTATIISIIGGLAIGLTISFFLPT